MLICRLCWTSLILSWRGSILLAALILWRSGEEKNFCLLGRKLLYSFICNTFYSDHWHVELPLSQLGTGALRHLPWLVSSVPISGLQFWCHTATVCGFDSNLTPQSLVPDSWLTGTEHKLVRFKYMWYQFLLFQLFFIKSLTLWAIIIFHNIL